MPSPEFFHNGDTDCGLAGQEMNLFRPHMLFISKINKLECPLKDLFENYQL
jgi:hypothetical protein